MVSCDLAVAEVAALAQQGIDQRRLAVVDVGDDGDVSDVVTHLIHCRFLLRDSVKNGAGYGKNALCSTRAGGVGFVS